MTVFFLLSVIWCSEATSGASVLIGAQSARYSIVFGDTTLNIPEYSNNGFCQVAVPGSDRLEIEVTVKNHPLQSRIRGRAPEAFPPQLAELESRLRALKGGFLTDQVAFVIHWLRNEIRFVSGVDGPREISDVLKFNRANCVGMANLAIFVLEKIGVKARYVTGIAYRMEDDVKLVLRGNVLHRWIEVHYDDVGWVFSDPSGKINYVEATYLVLGVEDQHALPNILKTAIGAQVELLSFENGFSPVQRVPGLDTRLGIRPNRLVIFPHP